MNRTMDIADEAASLSDCKTLSGLDPLALKNALTGVASRDCTRSSTLSAARPSAGKEEKKDNRTIPKQESREKQQRWRRAQAADQ